MEGVDATCCYDTRQYAQIFARLSDRKDAKRQPRTLQLSFSGAVRSDGRRGSAPRGYVPECNPETTCKSSWRQFASKSKPWKIPQRTLKLVALARRSDKAP